MKVAILFCLLLTVVHSIPHNATVDSTLDADWKEFKSIFGKHYDGENDISRRLIWEENVRKVMKHNKEYLLGRQTYSMGVNQFSDLKHEQIKPSDISKFIANSKRLPGFRFPLKLQQDALPDSVDWRTKGCVTPVKDQNVKNQTQCHSSWAFTATGAMESLYCISHKKLISLSEQELIDCNSLLFNSDGCNTYYSLEGFVFASLFGMVSENDYPYTGKVGLCNFTTIYSKNVASVAGYFKLIVNPNVLQYNIATVGPTTALIYYNLNFLSYKGGIFYDPACLITIGLHSVLIVGYGVENGTKYWIIKNSWGTQWGENGYMRMKIDETFQCGIFFYNVVPIIGV